MKRLIRFYEDIQPANDIEQYTYSDVIGKWSDYRLQVRTNYIKWLFPLKTDIGDTTLKKGLIQRFRTSTILRRRVVRATLRMMRFYGYSVDTTTMNVVPIKSILQQEQNLVIGMYNPDNFERITRMMTFLVEIKMENLSALVFLMTCRAMQDHPDLKQLVHDKYVLQDWVKTQKYLRKGRYKVESTLFNEKLDDWEKQSIEELIANTTSVHDAWDVSVGEVPTDMSIPDAWDDNPTMGFGGLSDDGLSDDGLSDDGLSDDGLSDDGLSDDFGDFEPYESDDDEEDEKELK